MPIGGIFYTKKITMHRTQCGLKWAHLSSVIPLVWSLDCLQWRNKFLKQHGVIFRHSICCLLFLLGSLAIDNHNLEHDSWIALLNTKLGGDFCLFLFFLTAKVWHTISAQNRLGKARIVVVWLGGQESEIYKKEKLLLDFGIIWYRRVLNIVWYIFGSYATLSSHIIIIWL